MVYQAQTEALINAKPGNCFHDPHNTNEYYCDWFVGQFSWYYQNLEDENLFYAQHFPLSWSDVHDPGSYAPLKEGNVITIEPGIYISQRQQL